MGISKTGCSKSITKEDLDAQYKQGFAEAVLIYRKRLREIVERLEEMKGDCVKVYSEYLDGEDLRRAMLLEEVQMVVKEVGGMNDKH